MNYNAIRRKTPEIRIGRVTIGGQNPLAIQSMTNTDTRDAEATIAQIKALSSPGSGEFDRMLRVAVEWMKKRSGCIICVPSDVAAKPQYRGSIAAGGPIIGIVRPDESGELLEGFCDILVQIDDASCADIAVEAIRAELQI